MPTCLRPMGRLKRGGVREKARPSLLPLVTEQVLETLLLSGVLTLVLEEDGTAVESEDFFQMLEDDTCLMVLEKGQSWSPKVRGPWRGCLGLQPFLVLSSLSLVLGAEVLGRCEGHQLLNNTGEAEEV